MKAETVKNDMTESSKWALSAEPIVRGLLSDWHLVPVEGKDDTVSRILDTACGIDYLLCSPTAPNVYGVASRVQYGKNYRTFTVRKERESGAETEYSKRIKSIAHGGLSPYYTMQAYVEDGEISGLAIVKTNDLMEYIERGFADQAKTREDKAGQAKFYVCGWDDMRRAGYSVKEYRLVEAPEGSNEKDKQRAHNVCDGCDDGSCCSFCDMHPFKDFDPLSYDEDPHEYDFSNIHNICEVCDAVASLLGHEKPAYCSF